MTTFERHDVQGFVVSGYARMHEARYLLLRVGDPGAARRWLGDLADRVTSSERPEEQRCVNVAFTSDGCAALGLEPGELSTFSAPFQEGMTSGHRQRVLGDVNASDPLHWAWGGPATEGSGPPASQVHVALLLFAKDLPTMEEVEAQESARLRAGGALEVVLRLVPEPLPGRLSVGKFGVEHFGFADGMSQPVIKGSGQEATLAGDDARRSVIETGEFILGYPNGYGELTPWPRLELPRGGGGDFGRNGTYLVVRHLAQDVAGFWSFLDDATKGTDGQTDQAQMERLGAKLVGRWQSGAPLVRSPHRDDPDLGTDNSFAYAAVDPYGQRCPLGAHIRRSNPRDSLGSDPDKALELANLHRIMRRGRVYGPGLDDVLGPDDEQDRGLLFMCVNANIERQFEFVQHTWCNNPKFAGLYDEQDPLLATPPAGGGHLTVQDVPVRRRIHGMPSFVTVRGGGYFFLPGIRALRTLAGLDR
jgi:Dyp-type peroxidase family